MTDIEGTTSSIAFVKEVLFPYARARLPAFVRDHGGEAEVARLLDDARALAGRTDLDTEGLIALLVGWIDEDRKATPLKALQGLLWAEGYENGAYRGHLYPDVAPALRRWYDAGVGLYVYSSGSVTAQKLLFGWSEAGDLTPLFSGYFDTRIGAKQSVESYRTIARAIGGSDGGEGSAILFLSDVPAELDAARAAGLATCQLVRPGTPPAGTHHQAGTFDALDRIVLS